MNLTINTDASHRYHSKQVGYAYYIICDEYKLRNSRTFNSYPECAIEAEIRAIGNAIALVLRIKKKKYSLITINTDCTAAIDIIRNKKATTNSRLRKIGGKVRTKYHNLRSISDKIRFKHVKAHSDNKDARSYVNKWCDQQAKLAMRNSSY
tara:strand:+ start:521 stop:973 length:453 start_codon:yes stop_codon:yes gene_type:complete